MNTFYGISFVIYFIFITLVLTTFIYGLKRDEYKFGKWAIITSSYFIFVIIYTFFVLRL
nr:MAG TPA: hypothetical protein [Caudoviricetes sp.]